VDRLDRDKRELLNQPIRNNFVHPQKENPQQKLAEKSEIKEMHEFSMNNQPIHAQ